MPRVIWTDKARADLTAQMSYAIDQSPSVARRISERLREAAQKLGVRLTGRPGRVNGTYEKSVPEMPYILCYAINDAGDVVILRVIHTARDWPSNTFPKP